MSDIGSAIRNLREKKDWSRNRLSEASGVHVNSIRNSETGAFNPTVSTAEKLLNAMGYELIIRKMPAS